MALVCVPTRRLLWNWNISIICQRPDLLVPDLGVQVEAREPYTWWSLNWDHGTKTSATLLLTKVFIAQLKDTLTRLKVF